MIKQFCSLNNWLILLLLLCIQDLAAEPKNILIIHSYNVGLSWTNDINQAIFDAFKNEQKKTVDLRCEYMDAKHYQDSTHLNDFKAYIKKKYKNTPIDLVIGCDNAAYSFLVSNHSELYKSAPILFCGVNYCDSIPAGFTGVMEDIEAQANIKNILAIHPNYKKLYIVNDRSVTATYIHQKILEVVNDDFPDLKYEFITDYSYAELQHKISIISPDDVVLFLLFNFDRLGHSYSYDVILDDLAPRCKAPIYGVWSFYLGKGIVGGKMIEAHTQGQLVSDMAKALLAGTPISQIPVVNGPVRFMYDYKVLKKHQLSYFDLPKEAVVINMPYDFIVKNKQLCFLLFIIFLLLFSLVVILYSRVKQTKSRLKLERQLKLDIEYKSFQLQKALDKAEEASRLKAKFLANISHEIRTPMNGILGFADLLQSNDDEMIQNVCIETIQKSTKQLLGIINNILDVSLIDSQQLEIVTESTNLIAFFDEIEDEFKKYPELNLIISSNKYKFVDPVFCFDNLLIKKVFSHLIDNSIKFSTNGPVEVGFEIKDSFIEFFVKDDGIGIDEAYNQLIFERFYQIPQNKSLVYGGNGVGLSISKFYIEKMGGHIWVHSQRGKGSVFYFSIPKIV